MNKRRRGNHGEEEVANASDPDDADWGAPSPTRRTRRSAKPTKSRPRKKQRRNSDSDLIEDDDSEESFLEASDDDEEEEPEMNPTTGRPMRRAAVKTVNYEESDDDDESAAEPVKREPSSRPASRGKPRQSLILTLKGNPSTGGRTTRARRGSQIVRTGETPPYHGTRRSSRLSHDDAEPLVELSGSGKHNLPQRKGTRTPSPGPVQARRPSRGGKGPKKMPSAIMEASQETSQQAQSAGDEGGQGFGEEGGEGGDEPMIAESGHGSQSPSAQGGLEVEEKEEELVVMESNNEDDDEDEGPVTRRTLRSRASINSQTVKPASQRRRKPGMEESSDFEPAGEDEEGKDEDDMSMSDDDKSSPRKRSKEDSVDSSGARRSRRIAGRTGPSQRSRQSGQSDHDSELDHDELAEEAELLAEEAHSKRRKRRRTTRDIIYDDQPKLRTRGNKPDYRLFRPELVVQADEEDAAPHASPQKNRRGATGAYRSLFSTQGPFGGASNIMSALGGAGATGATGGVDSDSSDDEGQQRAPRGLGGAVGMTPTATAPPTGLLTHNNDALPPGAPANLGKVKDRKLLADADPLGVDQNVSFEGVGGLDGHIDQLKEMVALPLLYPEVFQRFHVTPPRGVLFHGPPGTGKTLLARALAASVSSQGKKVTFYMRKGADALSKWVGEAEKQLRLLFEEARKNQPSIIFFDEIDGLAPVRSSKQEQIHASIVATLLALMDGMDGRGQVIVIGATNRPDSVDPALRRPGRFDREFYFPLPNQVARRSIIDIHTKGWDPPLQLAFKDQLAEMTKGYGGADLRALCTEAALNAVQGTFPQIYRSDKKLVIDPSKIKVLAKDFMISVNKMVPSSERTASSGAAALAKEIEPLLRAPLREIGQILDEAIPQRKKLTPLEEAQFDDREDERGFEREVLERGFEKARIFRPRLLIRGVQGMGQHYLGGALLHRFETLHVQSFDLPSLLEDSTRSPEATVVQFFKEVRRHKPSVIYIPNVDVWYQTVGAPVIKTFTSLLRSLPPNDPVLVLGILEMQASDEELDRDMLRDLFGYSQKNQFPLLRPDDNARAEYFDQVMSFIRMSPLDFPTTENRKKRQLTELEVAPAPEASIGPSKEDLKAQRKRDRLTLNMLKLHLQPIMDQIKLKYKKFRTPAVDESLFQYLYDEQDPNTITTDLTEEQRQQQMMQRPYELASDKKGVQGLREVVTGHFFYNVDIVMIERRLSNGYYKRGKDFLADIKRLAQDSRTSGDSERTLKANELLTNVEVDLQMIEQNNPAFFQECEAVFVREQARDKNEAEKAKRNAGPDEPVHIRSNVPPQASGTTAETSGPVVLGERVPGPPTLPPVTPVRRVGPPASAPLSNGVSTELAPQSNGSTVPSRPPPSTDEDAPMPDAPAPDSYQSLYTTPGGDTQGTGVGRPSQEGPHTQVSARFRPGDYHNSASTTTSGQKTDRSSGAGGAAPARGAGDHNNTQGTSSSNATHTTNGGNPSTHPDLASILQPWSDNSQLPNTQSTQGLSLSQSHSGGSSQSAPSQGGGGRTSAPAALATILNTVPAPDDAGPQHPPPPPPHPHTVAPAPLSTLPPPPTSAAKPKDAAPPEFAAPHPPLTVDAAQLTRLHAGLVARSAGLSVEQLEQVRAALMDAVWRARGSWNRVGVAEDVGRAFEAVVRDIEETQGVFAGGGE